MVGILPHDKDGEHEKGYISDTCVRVLMRLHVFKQGFVRPAIHYSCIKTCLGLAPREAHTAHKCRH